MADPIKHVVVLMLENRSFDQMLGCMANVDGISPKNFNIANGKTYYQQEAIQTSFRFDPMHECSDVLQQIADNNGGFVQNFAEAYEDADPEVDYQSIMDYFKFDEVPALHKLAREFAVCDRWFSSVPGPTWANRFFVHSGTSLGCVDMGLFHITGYHQETIYDRFDDAGVRWAIYAGDVPQCLIMSRLRRKERRKNFNLLDAFYSHCARDEREFPEFVFIEPRYFLPHQNDDHPPHDVVLAQELLASVYNALRANEELWNSTLLVVLYDEHGGFYDHVSPPETISPDGESCDEFDFRRLGVRVPAVFASPWIDARVFGSPQGLVFDHTSLIRYVCNKWSLPALKERDSNATNFEFIIRREGQVRPTSQSIILRPRPRLYYAQRMTMAPAKPRELNENQKALVQFMESLKEEPSGDLHEAPLKMMAAGATADLDPEAAKAKFQNWIKGADEDGTTPFAE